MKKLQKPHSIPHPNPSNNIQKFKHSQIPQPYTKELMSKANYADYDIHHMEHEEFLDTTKNFHAPVTQEQVQWIKDWCVFVEFLAIISTKCSIEWLLNVFEHGYM